jgi:hypothetical protein
MKGSVKGKKNRKIGGGEELLTNSKMHDKMKNEEWRPLGCYAV